jgi:hypothetical protein
MPIYTFQLSDDNFLIVSSYIYYRIWDEIHAKLRIEGLYYDYKHDAIGYHRSMTYVLDENEKEVHFTCWMDDKKIYANIDYTFCDMEKYIQEIKEKYEQLGYLKSSH